MQVTVMPNICLVLCSFQIHFIDIPLFNPQNNTVRQTLQFLFYKRETASLI